MNRKERIDYINSVIRTIADFPKPGIQFKDITTLLADPKALEYTYQLLEEDIPNNLGITKIVGLESRGFLFGTMLAKELNLGFVPVRKPGKLPFKTYKEAYDLEYGSNSLEIHVDAIKAGEKVVIHDDLMATGGSALAAKRLVEKCGGEVVHYSFIIELAFLMGRKSLQTDSVSSIITID